MMRSILFQRGSATGMLMATALLLGLGVPRIAAAGTPSGEASAAKVSIQAVIGLLGTRSPAVNVSLADTGSLTGSGDMRQASMLTGSVPSVLGCETLHATTVSAPDEVTAESSLSNLALNLAGNTLGVAFVMARATAPTNGAQATGVSQIEGMTINGSPVLVSGTANQTIPILGGKVVLNEQQLMSDGSMVVNAIHVVIYGVADVTIGSAAAGAGASNGGGGILSLLGELSTPQDRPYTYARLTQSALPDGGRVLPSHRFKEI